MKVFRRKRRIESSESRFMTHEIRNDQVSLAVCRKLGPIGADLLVVVEVPLIHERSHSERRETLPTTENIHEGVWRKRVIADR